MQPECVSLFVRYTFLSALVAGAFPSLAGPLNDTGVTACSNGTATVTCSSVDATYPGQDASWGRDAAAAQGSLTKTGSGPVGFDFTKLGNDGVPVADNAVVGAGVGQHTCTRDNTTGLVWDVLLGTTANPTLAGGSYAAWNDPNSATNGGYAGSTGVGTAASTTYKVNAANGNGQCGGTGWRVPTVRELLSISNLGTADRPPGYFSSNTPNGPYPASCRGYVWSSQTVRGSSSQAWVVSQGGQLVKATKDSTFVSAACAGSGAYVFTMIVR